jgi:hypothetical protein
VALGSGSGKLPSAPAVTTHYVGSGCAVLTEHDAEWVTDRVGEDSDARLALTRLSVTDSGEILTLQRAAYVTEAQRHDDIMMPAAHAVARSASV